jgi:hypothetical protein
MKNRLRFFDMLPDNRPAKLRLTQMMVDRYRRLQRVKADDPVVYDLMVQQMVLQDEALGLLQQQRGARDDPARFEALQGELRQKVRQLIDVSLQERQKRVEKLEQMLQEQKARLAQDQANPEALVDQHMATLKSDVDEVRKLMGGRRGMGGGMIGGRHPPATERADEGR